MDGNGRWAKKRLLPRLAGHKKGLEALQIAIKSAMTHKIPTVTLYAFSTENWNRPSEEISGLMSLFSDSINNQTERLIENNISFISNASADNPLVKNVYKNIEEYKKSLEIWKRKINYMKKLEY